MKKKIDLLLFKLRNINNKYIISLNLILYNKIIHNMNNSNSNSKIKEFFLNFSIFECLKRCRKMRELNELMRNEKTCLICWDKIDEADWVTCVKCNIFLHKDCERRFRNNKGYLKCPHCMQVGYMGAPQWSDTEDPIIESPAIEDPLMEGPTVEESTIEGPTIEDQLIEGPTIEYPLIEDPLIEGPTIECSRV